MWTKCKICMHNFFKMFVVLCWIAHRREKKVPKIAFALDSSNHLNDAHILRAHFSSLPSTLHFCSILSTFFLCRFISTINRLKCSSSPTTRFAMQVLYFGGCILRLLYAALKVFVWNVSNAFILHRLRICALFFLCCCALFAKKIVVDCTSIRWNRILRYWFDSAGRKTIMKFMWSKTATHTRTCTLKRSELVFRHCKQFNQNGFAFTVHRPISIECQQSNWPFFGVNVTLIKLIIVLSSQNMQRIWLHLGVCFHEDQQNQTKQSERVHWIICDIVFGKIEKQKDRMHDVRWCTHLNCCPMGILAQLFNNTNWSSACKRLVILQCTMRKCVNV